MIRELEELWEAELVPMLKAELSEELSVEQRIVNASLRAVEHSQRAGVEALFAVVGTFQEDLVVPAAALDVLAPLICSHAGIEPPPRRPHLRVRKWLSVLLNASLLVRNGAEGVSVHDLIRDVMIARARAAASGGLEALQREVVRLFLAAYDDASTADTLKPFFVQSMRHHVAHALQPHVPVHEDSLLMNVIGHKQSSLCAQAVGGIGVEVLRAEIAGCEAANEWWPAAQLWLAVSTFAGQRGAEDLKRAVAALQHVTETAQSRALESRVLTLLMFNAGGYDFASPEYAKLLKRQKELAELVGASDDASAAASFHQLQQEALRLLLPAYAAVGTFGHVHVTPEVVEQGYKKFAESSATWNRAALVAPERWWHMHASSEETNLGIMISLIHWYPRFDKEHWAGQGGAKLRANIERYDFRSMHAAHKTGGTNNDAYLYGDNEAGLLLWYGDLQGAKVGWAKQVDSWKRIEALVASGERTWREYVAARPIPHAE